MKKLILLIALFPFLLKSQSALESEFLNQLNSYRDSLGLTVLEYDSNLSIASKYHVDYLFGLYELNEKSTTEKNSHKASHYQSVDLEGFDEIVTPKERVELLTNFNCADEILIDGFKKFKGDKELSELISKISKRKSNNEITFKIDGVEVDIKDINIDLSITSRATSYIDGFKSSKKHHGILIKKFDENIKIGIYEKDGSIVVVYGYPKN